MAGHNTGPPRPIRRACYHLSDFLFGAAVLVSAMGLFGIVMWSVGGFVAEFARWLMSHAAP